MSGWAKKLKIFVFYVNAYQRVTSAQNFNQVDRITRSVDTREPPSPDAPGLTNKVATVARMDDMQGLRNIHFPALRLMCLQPLRSTQSASNRYQH